MKPTRHPWVGGFALLQAALVAFVVARVLPARVPSVDAPLLSLSIALFLAGIGLVVGTGFASRLALLVLSLALLAGLAIVTVLVLAVAEVSGVYGSIGEGIGLLFALSIFVVVPYLVALPAAQIYFLLRARRGVDARAA